MSFRQLLARARRGHTPERPRRVVYTVEIGSYTPRLPDQEVDNSEGTEFVCFTDDPELTSKHWRIEVVPRLGLDAGRESRHPKILAHRVLADYDQSVYVDTTVELAVDPAELFAQLENRPESMLCFAHPERDCLYDEAEVVIAGEIDDEERIRRQMATYRRLGHPPRAGLIAGALLVRDHRDPALQQCMEWWYQHVLAHSKRDQLSFNFVARRLGYSYGVLAGALDDNSYMRWPVRSDQRIPYGFDDDTYLWLNADVAAAGADPRAHYLRHGRDEGRPIRYFPPVPLDHLANRYGSDKGRLCFNRHFYSRVYDRYLAEYRESPIIMVEIGLLRHDQQGGGNAFSDAPSLGMWSDYLTKARIIGFDIADFSGFSAPRCTTVQGDQGNRDDLERLCHTVDGAPTVIIDDGSHASHHQQVSLGYLFPRLAPGGLYFIEDLHYQPPQWEPEGAPLTRDVLRRFKETGQFASPFMTADEAEQFTSQVESIEFYDSMDYGPANLGQDALVVIRKRT